VDRPFNKPDLSPEEFLRIVAHGDTLSQSLQRRAASPAPPFVTLRIVDPQCYKFMALFPWLKEFIIKEGVSKAPVLQVLVSPGDPGRSNRKSQSFSEIANNTCQPPSGGPGPSNMTRPSYPFKPIPLSSTQAPLT
jgi:hypothetical protein